MIKEEPKSNDYSPIIAQALDEMRKELGANFSLETVNLAELKRRMFFVKTFSREKP